MPVASSREKLCGTAIDPEREAAEGSLWTLPNLLIGAGKIQGHQHRRRIDPAVHALPGEDGESEHRFIEADMMRIDLDEEPVAILDLIMGVDER